MLLLWKYFVMFLGDFLFFFFESSFSLHFLLHPLYFVTQLSFFTYLSTSLWFHIVTSSRWRLYACHSTSSSISHSTFSLYFLLLHFLYTSCLCLYFFTLFVHLLSNSTSFPQLYLFTFTCYLSIHSLSKIMYMAIHFYNPNH